MNRLIIPMLVTAFATGKTGTTRRQIPAMSPNYKMAPAVSVLGSRNTPGAKARLDPLEAGVHLHFILPDAFTHSEDGTDYPAVPNRYVVTRIWQNPGERMLQAKCTVIESDFISTDKKYKGSVSIPFFSDSDRRRQWRYLGRSFPANAPLSGGEYLDKLTATGSGDPLFAAYYPNCKGVFGYHDDLSDLPNAPSVKLTYFVAGYFSGKAADPFCGVKTPEEFANILNALKLSTDENSPACDSCILYGAVDSIEWKGFAYTEYCPDVKGRVNAAFANTSAEALSLTIQNALGEESGFTQRMITALQHDLYDEAEKTDGNFKIDDEIHCAAFAREDKTGPYNHLSIDKNTSLENVAIGERYSQIRKLGRELGVLERELASMREKLFYAWEQYIWHYEDEDEKPGPNVPDAKLMLDLIQSICMEIQALCKSLEEKKKSYTQKLGDLERSLPSGATCPEGAGDVFFSPKDPVLLLSGPGIKRSFAFGEDGRFTQNGTLFCQSSPLSSPTGKESVFSRCFSDLSYMRSLPDFYSDMLFQTALTVKTLLGAIEATTGTLKITGTPPSEIALNREPLGRTTLFMIWGANYYPTRTDNKKDNTVEGWDLEYGDTSLVYKGGFLPEQIAPHYIDGKILLTPHAVKTFSAAISRYADIYEEDPAIKDMADKIKDMAIISQNLSGFSDYFSGLSPAVQFPVMGFNAQSDAAAPIVSAHVSGDRLSVLPDSALLPMRGGYVKISDLSLVSTFGQTQTLVEASYYNDCEIDFAETVQSPFRDFGLMPPAFSVPARLNADFVSAVNRSVLTSAAPETSPVCGIFIPEILNRRLLAYMADGKYLGMVKTVYRAGKPTVRWLSAPGMASDFGGLDIPNPSLKSFLKALINTENAFYEFYGLMDRYLDMKQNFGSLMWGRPLVLADFKIRFELIGSPPFSKRIEDFGKYDTLGAENIRFKLKLGDMQRVADGLLGWFNGEDFSGMYPPFGAENPHSPEGYVKYSAHPDISLSDLERHFTLLLEPDTPFTIHTGILPVKTVYFEAAHAKISQELPLSAEVSPVLGQMGQIGLPPLPESEDKREYSWHVLSGSEYQKSAIGPPMVSFEETMLMDGFIVKE